MYQLATSTLYVDTTVPVTAHFGAIYACKLLLKLTTCVLVREEDHAHAGDGGRRRVRQVVRLEQEVDVRTKLEH